LEHPVLVAEEDKYLISAATWKLEMRPTVVWRLSWRNQMDGQKPKELLRSETQFAMFGKDARSLSKERGNAAIQIKRLRLAPDH
jgi:hypothetical protein